MSHVALSKCFFCGEDNEVILSTRMKDISELDRKVSSMRPCPKCESYMKAGIIFITIDDSKSEKGWTNKPIPNPYRTGGFFVIREEALTKMINDPRLIAYAQKMRWMFIEDSAARQIGMFDVGEKNEIQKG